MIEKLKETMEKFPIGSTVYFVDRGYDFVDDGIVYGYLLTDEILLISTEDNVTVEPDLCYTTYEEAELHLTPDPKTVKIAIDEFGREIQFAVFDTDKVIDVIENYAVHTNHCCVIHGCKYGDDNCPVVKKQMLQLYRCQDCDDNDTTWKDIREEFKKR